MPLCRHTVSGMVYPTHCIRYGVSGLVYPSHSIRQFYVFNLIWLDDYSADFVSR